VEQPNEGLDDNDLNRDRDNFSGAENFVSSPNTNTLSADEEPAFTVDICDLRNWDNLDNKIGIFSGKGAIREENLVFPVDKTSRHFSYACYSKRMSNG
uniref:Uncharacterized protein n=1 Tax=Oryza brachyantha TaxID=4533 RepID=J3KUK3_ORYBR